MYNIWTITYSSLLHVTKQVYHTWQNIPYRSLSVMWAVQWTFTPLLFYKRILFSQLMAKLHYLKAVWHVHVYHQTYFRHDSVTWLGTWYLASMICVRVSLAPPEAKGECPVINMNRITPKLHTSATKNYTHIEGQGNELKGDRNEYKLAIDILHTSTTTTGSISIISS